MEGKRAFSKSLFRKREVDSRNIAAIYQSLQNDKIFCNIN